MRADIGVLLQTRPLQSSLDIPTTYPMALCEQSQNISISLWGGHVNVRTSQFLVNI